MLKLLMTLGVCLVLAACNHPSGESGPATTHENGKDKGAGNGGGY
jgi:hypothetical protein